MLDIPEPLQICESVPPPIASEAQLCNRNLNSRDTSWSTGRERPLSFTLYTPHGPKDVPEASPFKEAKM